jgi:catechol 2,3-dioxygenase-like lactoylglutathione lyase family enzyme
MLALEVVPLPVTDIDRALAFYTEQAGFTLDVDYRPTADFRVVQLTPPGSACSVQLVIADSPGRVHKPVSRHDRPRGRSGEIDRSRRHGRCNPAQGPSRHVGRRMERGAGPQA